jgi:Tfp pilus assembly protein PilO
MNSQRLRLVLLGLIGVTVVIFVGVFFMGQSTLKAKSQKLVDLKLQSDLADQQLNSLKQAKKQVAQYSYFKEVAKSVIPSDKDQAQAILDISRFADQSGFLIASITFPNSTLDKQSVAAVPAAGAPAGNAASAKPSSIISQAKPVPGIAGLYSIELTVTPQSGSGVADNRQVTYTKMIDFLKRIEHNRRTAQITQVTVEPKLTENSNQQFFNFTLIINIFIKPAK